MKKIIFVNSHPIQYFAPLYKYLSSEGMDVEVWYGSDESVRGAYDKGFGIEVKWDVPLLEGYKNRFFRNHSWKPSHFKGFWGLLNLGMVRELFKIPPSIIVVHGWGYATNTLVILAGALRGHTLCLRCEMPQNQELMKMGVKQEIKKWGLKNLLFPRFKWFLYIGTQNELFYKSYGIPERKLLFCPYCVDNARYQKQSAVLRPEKNSLKAAKGIPAADKVIIYSGKYIAKKRPLDLIQAFAGLEKDNVWLIMIGEGELRATMQATIAANKISNILLTGFINQSEIADYYALGDIFVMCSTLGETWGLSVNEAMNFGLPLLISETTGCSSDLVREGVNGYLFKTGNTGDLTGKLNRLLRDLDESPVDMGQKSLEIVNKYSFKTILSTLQNLVSQ